MNSFNKKLNKKLFSQAFGNCVRFTIGKNEIKLPINNQISVIYFKNDETITSLKNKIISTDKEYVQKLIIRDLEHKQEFTDEIPINDIINKPFEIFINNYLSIKHFPSLNQIVITNTSRRNLNISDPVKNYLYSSYLKSLTNKEKIFEDISKLKTLYETMYSEYEKSEKLVDKNLEMTRSKFMILGILFFILHLLGFYYLIYYAYSWDNIEPITYIVGNAYWIAGLFFFIVTLRRLDLSFVFTEKFTNHFLKKLRFIYATNPIEKEFFNAELREINRFLNSIQKIKH
jgi:hypothetical protein